MTRINSINITVEVTNGHLKKIQSSGALIPFCKDFSSVFKTTWSLTSWRSFPRPSLRLSKILLFIKSFDQQVKTDSLGYRRRHRFLRENGAVRPTRKRNKRQSTLIIHHPETTAGRAYRDGKSSASYGVHDEKICSLRKYRGVEIRRNHWLGSVENRP